MLMHHAPPRLGTNSSKASLSIFPRMSEHSRVGWVGEKKTRGASACALRGCGGSKKTPQNNNLKFVKENGARKFKRKHEIMKTENHDFLPRETPSFNGSYS